MDVKKLIFQILIIFLLSFLSGMTYNAISENGISFFYKPPNFETGSHLTLEQTHELLREGRTLFIDTRYPNEFQKSHIKGAVNLPASASREEIMDFLEPIQKNQIILCYCNTPACNSSRRLAGFLSYLGYEKVYVYLAGFEEWESKKYPVEKDNEQN